jgi:hypothetical protein
MAACAGAVVAASLPNVVRLRCVFLKDACFVNFASLTRSWSIIPCLLSKST